MKTLNGFFKHPGSKNNSGLVQFIINLIPPHTTFIEAFAGSAVIARNIYDGQDVILFEKDLPTYLKLCKKRPNDFNVFDNCFIKGLNEIRDYWDLKDTFIYADPPYPISSRKSQSEIYNCEMTDQEHIDLLNLLKTMPCDIMISTRENEIYNEMLKDWTKLEFETVDRGGKAIEQIFVNYPVPPEELHTYKFIGKDFTERQYLKRKKKNFINKLQKIKKEQPHLYRSIIKEIKPEI